MQENAYKKISTILFTVLGVILLLFALFPVYWLVQLSLKIPREALVMPPKWFFVPIVDNYVALVHSGNFTRALVNSLIVMAVPSFLSLVASLPMAYGLSKTSARAVRDNLSFWVLSLRMLPPIVILIPFYVMFTRAGLMDTVWALIIIYLTVDMPIAIWLLKGFFDDVPYETIAAAKIDGYSEWEIFYKMHIPIVKSGIVVTGMMCAIFNWAEFLFAMTLTDHKALTIPVAIFQYMSFGRINWGLLASSGVLGIVPMLIFMIIIRKHLVRGMTLGVAK